MQGKKNLEEFKSKVQRPSTELAQFLLSDTTFWWVSEEDKPHCWTFPTVSKRFIGLLLRRWISSTFVFPDSLRFFLASIEWISEPSKISDAEKFQMFFPSENTAENIFLKPFPEAS